MGRSKGKRKAPPNPDDFDPPTTNGWHALTDWGWEKIQKTDECPIPDNALRGQHVEFEGTIDQWQYKYRLRDGTGTQVNKHTEKSRPCRWFENGESMHPPADTSESEEETSSAGNAHQQKSKQQLKEENKQLAKLVARYRQKEAQMVELFEYSLVGM